MHAGGGVVVMDSFTALQNLLTALEENIMADDELDEEDREQTIKDVRESGRIIEENLRKSGSLWSGERGGLDD